MRSFGRLGGGRGRASVLPAINGTVANVDVNAESGTTVTTLTASPPGGTWAIEPNAHFAIDAETGIITTTSTPKLSGTTYSPDVTYTVNLASISVAMSIALSITATGEVEEPDAPVLIGPLDIDESSGEAIYTADLPARHYWMLSANGTTPSAAEIVAGTGAIAGDDASAFGYFDAADGSVQADIDFPGGIDEAGAVFSVVARVEPDGEFSNILRDTDVDVQTLPLSATFVSVQTGASPNFGSLAAGWYLAVVMQRNGTMTGLTPPAQAQITSAAVDIVPTPASGIKPMRAYLVELTATRSGAWAIGQSGGSSYATALYSLSSEPMVVASANDFGNNTTKNYDFNLTVEAADVLIGAFNGHVDVGAENAADDVTQDAAGSIVSFHTYRVASGVAPASGLRDVYNDSTGNFSSTSALALALRRAA